jgi:hypothetical protein
MRLAIHQPEFMPWMGFFNKMALADEYVIFDHVQFKKRYFENRNRIVSARGEINFITVPVLNKECIQPINRVEIDNSRDWKRKLLKSLMHNYSKAQYFEEYYADLEQRIVNKKFDSLIALNMMFINFFREHLDIKTPMVYSSALDVSSFRGSDLILQICLKEKTDTYLCGSSGRDYLKQDEFKQKNVNIEWIDYKSPHYKQTCDQFVPNLSTFDLLVNEGPGSKEIIKKSKKINNDFEDPVCTF